MALGAEWLEADGRGGFASGTADGIRTRRYHALLLCATNPPSGRMVLVNGIEAWVETKVATYALTSQRYAPDIVFPDGAARISAFVPDPWPTWTYHLPDGTVLTHEVLVTPAGATILRWRCTAGAGPCRLKVRPLMSGRDYHALHHENSAFDLAAVVTGETVCFVPYKGVPPIAISGNGRYAAEPTWYHNFFYTAEADRGLDALEDLAAPGIFAFDLSGGAAVMLLRADREPVVDADALIEAERTRRAGFAGRLERAAASYRVRRGAGQTLVAGYPWFTDWGRDTFIAMRGLVLGTGDVTGARDILTAWAPYVSAGMLPNRFPDQGDAPEYNAVDAALWYVVAVHDHLAMQGGGGDVLQAACEAILTGYAQGTRFGIAVDADGLLRAGAPGVQLTWMDAKVGDHVVTPRIGKPVEVQALWINALRVGAGWSDRWRVLAARATTSFVARFPNPTGGLYDVVDADHVPGRLDARLRPNQIFAVGGLPFPILTGDVARGVVDRVESALLTPLGLRTLAPDDPAYVGQYRGGPAARDGAYHQGTVWPWLMGPFVDAWLSVRDRSDAAKAEARTRFLAPLMRHLDQAGLGHVSEVADGDAPHTPGGCPFQAWSLGELIRICKMLDFEPS